MGAIKDAAGSYTLALLPIADFTATGAIAH